MAADPRIAFRTTQRRWSVPRSFHMLEGYQIRGPRATRTARVAIVRRVTLRRQSQLRGRRLRLDEALLERFAMSRAGWQFLLRVAPKIDKAVIPRTKGRLSATGIDKVGLVTTTGAKSGERRTQ